MHGELRACISLFLYIIAYFILITHNTRLCFEMDTGVRQLLQTNQEEATICIDLYYLLPELRKRKLVTDLEFRQFSDERKTPEDKNKALLRAIETKGGEKSFDLFVQALEAEKQHTGHEHLAKVLRDAKAALKSRLIVPPKPPPKTKKVCYIVILLMYGVA